MHPTDLQELACARQAAILEQAERRRVLRRAGRATGRARAGPTLPRLAALIGVSPLPALLQAPRRALALLLRRSRGPAGQRTPAGARQQPA
jgi:hypothetical protein